MCINTVNIFPTSYCRHDVAAAAAAAAAVVVVVVVIAVVVAVVYFMSNNQYKKEPYTKNTFRKIHTTAI